MAKKGQHHSLTILIAVILIIIGIYLGSISFGTNPLIFWLGIILVIIGVIAIFVISILT